MTKMEVHMLVTPGRSVKEDDPVGLDRDGYVRDCPAHVKTCLGLAVKDSEPAYDGPFKSHLHKVLVTIQGKF
jgi:hypothetical protein